MGTIGNQSSANSKEVNPTVSMPRTTIETLPHRNMCHCMRMEGTLPWMDCDSCDYSVEDNNTTKGVYVIASGGACRGACIHQTVCMFHC